MPIGDPSITNLDNFKIFKIITDKRPHGELVMNLHRKCERCWIKKSLFLLMARFYLLIPLCMFHSPSVGTGEGVVVSLITGMNKRQGEAFTLRTYSCRTDMHV